MKATLMSDETLAWHCPGCKGGHGVPVDRWTWNGSLESPTLSPSVLIHAHDAAAPFKPQPRCHCFVKDGRIQFLSDCEHEFSGRTVEMEEA